jgi:hypothetical protein
VVLQIDGTAPVVAHGEEREFRSALDKVVGRLTLMLTREQQQHGDHWPPPLSESAREAERS